ncbi:inorganic phosphate transporter [Nitrospirillum viridazoti]|uniref:Phosphate transporter n=1 Tax=Nitrospirillum viridazoti CBAmc TaxID=1441467 RepID=A0A248JYI1_9PROT|nr:inorganic phosphate transporter [Nitrospirillum amazonense]ASG23773.1 anion permease [Nitrospirillum amazonense CBAmc]TWB44822.1 PiT family inorganic phosphate transporter [Nitrospirillum amazonense]
MAHLEVLQPSLDESPLTPLPAVSGGVAARLGTVALLAVLALGLGYVAVNVAADLRGTGTASALPFVLLGVALLIALGFEFVNGFHDTANAVATVIYTHSLPAHAAVVLSGLCNFAGVLLSTGAVAYGIVSLLPVELILRVGSEAGFAMVFALLISAVLWNLGTWALGLPSSSSHTLIGSIIGVGLMNQLMAAPGAAASGVDWGQALKIIQTLLISPIVGFVCAAALLMLMRGLIKDKALFQAPKGRKPPPAWIRALLVLTCSGVSFAHGSNDGQKGMGLIMLILIGTMPAAYGLNRGITAADTPAYVATFDRAGDVLGRHAQRMPADPRAVVEDYVRSGTLTSATLGGLHELTASIADQLRFSGALSGVAQGQMRNDMYLSAEALRRLQKQGFPLLDDDDRAVMKELLGRYDHATRYIPTWVKVGVAIALGLGTMVGWKRTVVTVGEKIGKEHLTYGQGASAQLVAMGTIGAADVFGLPVSTTHVLSSGVAGTMAANGSGLQWSTVRNMATAWVLTLPASIVLAGGLFWLFRHLF